MTGGWWIIPRCSMVVEDLPRGWILGHMLVNILAPWSIWDSYFKVIRIQSEGSFSGSITEAASAQRYCLRSPILRTLNATLRKAKNHHVVNSLSKSPRFSDFCFAEISTCSGFRRFYSNCKTSWRHWSRVVTLRKEGVQEPGERWCIPPWITIKKADHLPIQSLF